MSNELQPWQRQRDPDGKLEPNLWFDRFTAYRLMGASRSLLGCVNQDRVKKGQKETNNLPGSWRNAAKEWDWKARAEAWDAHLRQREEAEWEARRREVREQDWEQGGELRELAARILAEGPKFLKTTRKVMKDGREVVTVALDGTLAVRAAEKGSQLQRLGAEMETDRQKVILALEKEVNEILDVLSQVLNYDDYQRVLLALSGTTASGTEDQENSIQD